MKVVEDRLNLSLVLAEDQAFNQAGADKALIQEICYGTLRWFIQLDYILGLLLDKPIRKKDQAIRFLLLTGLYQLRYMRIPAHAVVSETVGVCRELKKESIKGLVNAVLRRYQRESTKLESAISGHESARTSHPDWFIEQVKMDWPEHWETLLDANNQYPPMYLRVNKLKTNRDDYLKLLDKAGIKADATAYSEEGVKLVAPCNVCDLPGFEEGMASVQELAAQLAAKLLGLQTGHKVLDACAAPGGKSAHILESSPEIEQLTCIEKDARRARTLQQTLDRLQLSASIRIYDALHVGQWWDGEAFDRILLDVPCTATGVIRRNPDIKLLRTKEQVSDINQLQYKLMNAIWPTLKKGGRLVYASCSVLKQENSDTISNFLGQQSDCRLCQINETWGIDTGYGKQILTGADDMDGFFYAVLEKE